jgi:hypothetical protein
MLHRSVNFRALVAIASLALLPLASGCGPWILAAVGGGAAASGGGGGGGGGGSPASGTPVTPPPPPPPAVKVSSSKSTVAVDPDQNVPADGVATAKITVTVKDPDGKVLPGQIVQIAASGTANQIGQPSQQTDAKGVAIASIASTKAETKTLTITVNPGGTPVVLSRKPTVEFVPGSAVRLGYVAAPATATEGQSISPAIEVEAQDAYGNRATSFEGTVALALGTNPGGAALGGTTQRAASNGLATFSSVSVSREGVGYTVVATAVGLPEAPSAPFQVSAVVPSWARVSPSGDAPAAVMEHSAVLDASGNVLIVFGGARGDMGSTPVLSNEVWTLSRADGTGGTGDWRRLDPDGDPPFPRASHSATYDAGSNRMTVFGGNPAVGYCGYDLNDVWVLAGADGSGGARWIALAPSGSAFPSGRSDHTAVYDPGSNRMIVFGGVVQCGAPNNEVWILTNANGRDAAPSEWIQVAPLGFPPEARFGHAAAYDAVTNRMIVFGGQGGGGGRLNDVWTLSNANGLTGAPEWSFVATAGAPPTPRANATAVYAAASNRLIVYGGDGILGDAWSLSNANRSEPSTPAWSQLFPTGEIPPARGSHTGVFRPSSSRMIIFGGRDCATGEPCAPLVDVRALFVR